MKTKIIFKALVLASVFVSACSKNDIADDFKGYTLPVAINVTRQGDDATRATYDGESKKLSFSTGDKLFVAGSDSKAGDFAGLLAWQSKGTFSGTIMTENEYDGTAEELLSSAADNAEALLIPAGYKSYEYLELDDEITPTAGYYQDKTNAFALTKAAAVEQFSFELAETYSSGFTLSPQNAIVSFTISGLTANKEVAVSFNPIEYVVISKSVTTSAEGVATFAIGLDAGTQLGTLTVDGNNIAMPTKTVEAGHIYNISRSAAPAGPTAYTLAESTVGMIVGSDGKAYAAADKDNLPSGVTAVAIVAYKGSETGEASPYTHGLAIAMKDAAAGGKVKWSSPENDESSLDNFTDTNPAVTTAQSGLSNSSGFDNESNYPAFYAALHNTITVSDGISAAAPASGTSGWFLPSLYQWNKIVQGLSGKTADLSDGGHANDNYMTIAH